MEGSSLYGLSMEGSGLYKISIKGRKGGREGLVVRPSLLSRDCLYSLQTVFTLYRLSRGFTDCRGDLRTVFTLYRLSRGAGAAY